FKAEAYVLTKEEGGRHTPFFTGYRPQFYFRTTDVTGDVKLPQGVEMVMPGDNVSCEVTLITPVALAKAATPSAPAPSPKSSSSAREEKELSDARNHHVAVRRVQESQLHDDEE